MAILILHTSWLEYNSQRWSRRPWIRNTAENWKLNASPTLGDEDDTNISEALAKLKICSSLKDIKMGRKVHATVTKRQCDSNIHVVGSLIEFYARCGRMTEARRIFDTFSERHTLLWNCLIMGYAQNGESQTSLELYSCMLAENGCTPNSETFLAALIACSWLAENEEGEESDGRIIKRDCLENVMAIHSQAVKNSPELDVTFANTLIEVYAKCGIMIGARAVFDRMQEQTVASWNALILGYVENGENALALGLFWRMRTEGFAPNAKTFVAALKACCAALAAYHAGVSIYADIRRCGLKSNAVVTTSLVDFYGKYGKLVVAQKLFDLIPQKSKNLAAWNAIIAAYGRQRHSQRVLDLFDWMQKGKSKPNGATFIIVLTQCSYAGFVQKGKEYFHMMWSRYKILPGIEHYNCLIDMLGHANRLKEAVAIIKSVPSKTNMVATWMAVLSACQKWKNVKAGKLAFECLLRVDRKHAPAYTLMANIYADAGLSKRRLRIEAIGRRYIKAMVTKKKTVE